MSPTLPHAQPQATSSSRETLVEVSSRYRSDSITDPSKPQANTFFGRWRQLIISIAVFLFLLGGTIGMIVAIFRLKQSSHHDWQEAYATSRPSSITSNSLPIVTPRV
ncbi:hypothetical protein TWF481_007798 [Arthrobotrys musiformis]|uniref:Uncharacterized protein n=1 Tax=Arthrobotrys musiformis TaxID=47236 RepID=A0AAV9W599_9PEZI